MALARHLADLGQVSAGAAHEFRNAAAAIDGFADLALRSNDPERAAGVRARDSPGSAGDEPGHERLPALRAARELRSRADRPRRRRRGGRGRDRARSPRSLDRAVGRVSGGRRFRRPAAPRPRQPPAQRRRGDSGGAPGRAGCDRAHRRPKRGRGDAFGRRPRTGGRRPPSASGSSFRSTPRSPAAPASAWRSWPASPSSTAERWTSPTGRGEERSLR